MSDLRISFEFFPPKTPKMEERLWETIRRLEPVDPRFVSVTYGAGGTTRDRTHRTVKRIVEETGMKPAAHLTCVSAAREEVLDVVSDYEATGVGHIVALRGDPPTGIGEAFEAHPKGFSSSIELIEGIRNRFGDSFDLSVGCYPEQHPESRGLNDDIAFLKAKQDAGATQAITQFFFEPQTYLDFVERARAGGVTMPIIPGIMLQANFEGLKRMSAAVKAHLPDWLHARYEGLENDPETRDLVTATVAADLCRKLADQGVTDFHFYTMNKAPLALATCRLLGVSPGTSDAAA